jgi:hypothetical protein
VSYNDNYFEIKVKDLKLFKKYDKNNKVILNIKNLDEYKKYYNTLNSDAAYDLEYETKAELYISHEYNFP